MIPQFLFRAFRANEVKVHELNYLFWECTTRCNLHCRHCGSDCTAAGSALDMPLEAFISALNTIPVKERPSDLIVALTGGEPLLRPDIEEVGRSIRASGVKWGMVSNGYFYDLAMHSRLISAGMSALTISLDGLADTHDWMRGRAGSYERALRAIGIAASEKRLAFDVVTCVNRRNLSQLQEIHDVLLKLNVSQWRLFTVIPIGRAKDDPDMQLTDSEFVEVMDFIKNKRQSPSKMNVTFSCEGYLGPYEQQVRPGPYFCRAGVNVASVLIDGRICACPNVDRDVFSQGNIYQDNLWDVWNNGFGVFRDRNWARKGQCEHCREFSNCLGNGMHNWHSPCENVLNCHYNKIVTQL